MIEQLRHTLKTKYCIRKWHIAVKHIKPCFLTTFVQHNYLEALFEKFGAYKSKYILKPILCQGMVHFTSKTKSPSHSKAY